MRAKAAFPILLGLVLFLTSIPGYSSVRAQTADFADANTAPRGPSALERVVEIVISHADNMLPTDEMIQVGGLSAKKSNYHGVGVDDCRFFYCLAPHFCSCPVCRGSRDVDNTILLFLDESPTFPMAIYTLDEFDLHQSAPTR